MKQIFFFIIIAIIPLSACRKQTDFILKGEMADSRKEPIIVVFDDPTEKLDTIYPENGKFTYRFTLDTCTNFRLIAASGECIPFFAEAGQKAELTGTFAKPEITGDGENGEYGHFLKSIRTADFPTRTHLAEKFIRSHPESFCSAYLINQFFVQTSCPDLKKIGDLISPLHGTIKDSRILHPIISLLTEQKKQNRSNLYVSYFSCKDRNGKYIPSSTSDDTYTLMNFWASWEDKSLVLRDSLFTFSSKHANGRLKVLNISLDYEKNKWLKACKPDSKTWLESCDFKGWSGQIVEQNNIFRLPFNILIDRNRKILATDLDFGEIKQQMKDLTADKK